MCEQRRATGYLLFVIGIFATTVAADEARVQQDKPDAAVCVQCQGRLRHGVFAIGGESTGTTITFHRITWELQLPDEASREFAKQHHGMPVVVTGRLRRVVATERKVRWIIDVTRVRERTPAEGGQDSATISIRGLLRAALSSTGSTPEYSVSTGSQKWKLDLVGKREFQTTAESLIGKAVLVNGVIPPPPARTKVDHEKQPPPVLDTLLVKTINSANRITVDPCNEK